MVSRLLICLIFTLDTGPSFGTYLGNIKLLLTLLHRDISWVAGSHKACLRKRILQGEKFILGDHVGACLEHSPGAYRWEVQPLLVTQCYVPTMVLTSEQTLLMIIQGMMIIMVTIPSYTLLSSGTSLPSLMRYMLLQVCTAYLFRSSLNSKVNKVFSPHGTFSSTCKQNIGQNHTQ